MTEAKIEYQINEPISSAEFVDLLNRSTLAARRPVDDPVCIDGMLKHGNLLVTAWLNAKMIGVSRSITDFHFACYLSDLAVDVAFQKQGIGKTMIRMTQEQLGPKCNLILLAAPAAVDYYGHIGFEQRPQCWILPGDKKVTQ